MTIQRPDTSCATSTTRNGTVSRRATSRPSPSAARCSSAVIVYGEPCHQSGPPPPPPPPPPTRRALSARRHRIRRALPPIWPPPHQFAPPPEGAEFERAGDTVRWAFR